MEAGEAQTYLRQNGLSEEILEDLLARKQIRASAYRGKVFYCAAIGTEDAA
jgi:hypothetical protein